MHEDELRFWANAHAPAGSEVAMAVLDLFGKIDSLRAEAKAPVLDRAPKEVYIRDNPAFPEEIKPFDGSTGTPEHGRCGRKENTPPGQ